jgi:hypothetical protein
LSAAQELWIRDYDATTAIPIIVDQSFVAGPGGTLKMIFEEDARGSLISFQPGIPVARGGTLELLFADEVNLASQVGRTIDLFDWSGVTPSGTFAVVSPYRWDLSKLYSSGEVTLLNVPEPTGVLLIVLCLCCRSALSRRTTARRKNACLP